MFNKAPWKSVSSVGRGVSGAGETPEKTIQIQLPRGSLKDKTATTSPTAVQAVADPAGFKMQLDFSEQSVGLK
jgi:hypothetical protein